MRREIWILNVSVRNTYKRHPIELENSWLIKWRNYSVLMEDHISNIQWSSTLLLEWKTTSIADVVPYEDWIISP